MIPGHLTMTFADANEGALFLIDTAGHIISERDRLIRRGVWGDLQDGLANLLDHRGQRSDNGIDVRLDYLLATAVKPSRPR